MPDKTRLEEYGKKSLPDLLDALGSTSIGSTTGQDTVKFLQSLISVRTAEMINKQLMGTAESIGKSANTIKEALAHAEGIGKETLENSSKWLTTMQLKLRPRRLQTVRKKSRLKLAI